MKNIFSIENQQIEENKEANLTFFTTESDWVFKKENILSKSKNTLFLNAKMKGKVYGIYNQNKLILSNE